MLRGTNDAEWIERGRDAMPKADPGRDLKEACATPGSLQRALNDTLLLLLNAVHLVDPEPHHRLPVRPLGDGTLPGPDLLGVLNVLSTHKRTKRTARPGDKIEMDLRPARARRHARTTLIALAMLLQTERCALCEATSVARDRLVMLYLKSGVGLRTYENVHKERWRWRKSFTGAGLFGKSESMRAFVAACYLALLGDAAEEMIGTAATHKTVARFRTITARAQTGLRAQVPDKLIAVVLASVFDFSWHSDRQVSATLKSLSGASLAPLFEQDTGELAEITADILPQGLLAGRPLPR